MTMPLRIIILADNTAGPRDVRGEHGLSYWIETSDHCLLFDTGQGLVLEDNARALNLDLDAVDTVVLSHGHYDHTGGLVVIERLAGSDVRVVAHPSAFLPKYKRTDTGTRYIGIPSDSRDALSRMSCPPVCSTMPMEVAPGVWMTGEIRRRHPEEVATESFCADAEGRTEDPLRDDQALFIETQRGTIVLLGCAHAGLINTLDHVQELTQGRPVHAVIGGMHLCPASESRLAWTLDRLRSFDLGRLVPLHCTGPKASAALWHAFPGICVAGGAGTRFEF